MDSTSVAPSVRTIVTVTSAVVTTSERSTIPEGYPRGSRLDSQVSDLETVLGSVDRLCLGTKGGRSKLDGCSSGLSCLARQVTEKLQELDSIT